MNAINSIQIQLVNINVPKHVNHDGKHECYSHEGLLVAWDDISEQFNSEVNHPKHYNSHPSGIECIAVIEHMMCNPANAIKYIWRNGLKPGETAIKDLEKAKWYIDREIERIKKK